MPDPAKRILLVGDSLYLAAIATVLRQQPSIQLVRADDTTLPDAILVCAHGDLAPALTLAEKYAGTPVLALDEATHMLTTIAGTRTVANTPLDLVRAIQKWAAR